MSRRTTGRAVAQRGRLSGTCPRSAARQARQLARGVPVGRPRHDQVISEARDYQEWHHRYDDPNSSLSGRLEQVRRQVGDALNRHPGKTRILSLCSGDGRDVLSVRDDARRVSAVLLELQPELAQQARNAAGAAGLRQVEVRTVDASRVDAYRGVVPADFVLLVGIFGNIADADVSRLSAFAPQLCRPRATLGRVAASPAAGCRESRLVTSTTRCAHSQGGRLLGGRLQDARERGRPALGVVRYEGPRVELQAVAQADRLPARLVVP